MLSYVVNSFILFSGFFFIFFRFKSFEVPKERARGHERHAVRVAATAPHRALGIGCGSIRSGLPHHTG